MFTRKFVTFPHGEVTNLMPTCCQQVVVMEFGERHDATDTTDFCPRQLLQTCCRFLVYVADLLRGNWCDGFWHLQGPLNRCMFMLFSQYCMFEFDTAHHHNIAVKRKKRLLVLMALDGLTDLYDNDASDTVVLRQYLRQYTYVDYRADDWLDKLLYALPLHGMDQQREDQEPGNFDS